MKRNIVKLICDVLYIVLLLLFVKILSISQNRIIEIISVVLIILCIISRIIIDIILWRCPKCGSHLPVKPFYKIVLNCPYCGADLNKYDIKK